jgi:hypothetical protein
MGRSSKLTAAVQAKICEAIRNGNTRSVAAAYAGISERSLYAWLKSGAESKSGLYMQFLQAVKKAECEAEMGRVKIILEAADENWTAAAWWLERRRPEEWSLRSRMDQEVQRQLQQQYQQQGLVEVDKVLTMWRGALQAIRDNVTDVSLLNAIIKDVLNYIPRSTRATLTHARPADGNGNAGNGEATNGEG